jgi:hypothetical protein
MNDHKTNRGRFSSWYNQKKRRSRTAGRRRSFGDASTNNPQYQHQPELDAGEDAADHLDDNTSNEGGGGGKRFGVRWGRSQSTRRACQQQHLSESARAHAQAQHHLNHNQPQLQKEQQQLNQTRPHPIHAPNVLATPAAEMLRDEYTAKLGAPINRESTAIPANARAAATPSSVPTRTPLHVAAAPRAPVASMLPPPNILKPQQQHNANNTRGGVLNHSNNNPNIIHSGGISNNFKNNSGIANNLNSQNKTALIRGSSDNSHKKPCRRQTPSSIMPPLTSPRNPSLLDTLHKLPGTVGAQLLQGEISGLDDISHWGDESTIASASLMPLPTPKKDPSPNSVILEAGMQKSPSSSNGSHGDYFMISNDHLLLNRGNSERNVVDMLPNHSKSSFNSNSSARRRANGDLQQQLPRFGVARNKVQLPGEYFRSYAFSDDPSASKPKIRRRDMAENRSLTGGGSSHYSSQSRSSACNVSVVSRGAFSVSTGGSSHASCMTRSTQGSINSTQSAPPNLWQVDRQLEKTKSKRNFEADTDFYKFPPLSPSRSLPGGNDSDLKQMLRETMTATFTTSRIPRGQSDWMDESKGVPNKVSISFRRLSLRSQVHDLEDCLDESPSMTLAEKKHPPAPPLHSDGIRTVQLNVITPWSSSNGLMSRKSSLKKVVMDDKRFAPEKANEKAKKKNDYRSSI